MKEKNFYQCTNCGYRSARWVGKCPQCGKFNSLEEQGDKERGTAFGRKLSAVKKREAVRLSQVVQGEKGRISTGLTEFDRVMGGGIVRDSVTILTSAPGGGTSTLALMAANLLAEKGLRVLYASGEESESQIKRRADRILSSISENIWIGADTCLNHVLGLIEEIDPQFIIVDSIQTFYLEEFLPSRAGNPTQTMECANELVRIAKDAAHPRAVFLIGQMNKNDELAGLRSLEHLVDTVLLMEGDGADQLRSVSATKNRFGSTGETGFFTMTDEGLLSIDNPSEYFMTPREKEDAVSGSALTVVKEGSRAIIAEVESLVSTSFTPYPARIVEAMKKDQLNTLISIAEERCGFRFYDKNVVVKTTGGIRFQEPSVSLAVLMSIISASLNRPIGTRTAFLADVGLTGELKRAPSMEARVRELDRMGFSEVYLCGGSRKLEGLTIQMHEKKMVQEVIEAVFGKVNQKLMEE